MSLSRPVQDNVLLNEPCCVYLPSNPGPGTLDMQLSAAMRKRVSITKQFGRSLVVSKRTICYIVWLVQYDCNDLPYAYSAG